MHKLVVLLFERDQSLEIEVCTTGGEKTVSTARQWLDNKYQELECEPLRASGKLLLIDKILSIAKNIGYDEFKSNRALLEEFATYTALIFDRPRTHIDTVGLLVSF